MSHTVISDESAESTLMTVFSIADNVFALDARLVVEVTRVGDITPVHDAPGAVSGIRNLRGMIITVIDTAVHLGLGSVRIGPQTRMLIVEHQKELFGFLVDTVNDAIPVSTGLVIRQPEGIDSRLSRFISGVWREANQLTAILDIDALFKWDEDET